jgi:hypothetical protein
MQQMPIRLVGQPNPHGPGHRMALSYHLRQPTVELVEVCECSILGLCGLALGRRIFKILLKA